MGRIKCGELWVSGFLERLPPFAVSSLVSHRDINKPFVLLFFLASLFFAAFSRI